MSNSSSETNSYQKSVIDFIDGSTIYAFATDKLSDKEEMYTTQNNRWAVGNPKITPINGDKMDEPNLMKRGNIIQFFNKRITLVNQPTSKNYELKEKLFTNYILIQDNPKIDIQQLTKIYDFEKIIFDGSNSNWAIKQWKASCDKAELNYYDVKHEGAYIIDAKNANSNESEENYTEKLSPQAQVRAALGLLK